jgi:hypothetical protein
MLLLASLDGALRAVVGSGRYRATNGDVIDADG